MDARATLVAILCSVATIASATEPIKKDFESDVVGAAPAGFEFARTGQAAPRKPALSGTVVFVCEHGNVKSLIACEWFNRLATERGLAIRAVSRGVTPEASVPPAIAAVLRADGFDVSTFEPRAFSAADGTGAVRVVGIGVDLRSAEARGDGPLDTWEGIPPASERYPESRDALRARIEALLTTLEEGERRSSSAGER